MEGLHPADLAIHITSVVVLFILLRVILWKPVSKYLEARKERIRAEYANADKIRLEAEETLAEYTRNVKEMEARDNERRRAEQMKTAEEARQILEDARIQAELILDEARGKIELEKKHAIESSKDEIIALATEMAQRILKRTISVDDSRLAADELLGRGQ